MILIKSLPHSLIQRLQVAFRNDMPKSAIRAPTVPPDLIECWGDNTLEEMLSAFKETNPGGHVVGCITNIRWKDVHSRYNQAPDVREKESKG